MKSDREVDNRLDILIRLVALHMTREMKQPEAIGFLARTGLDTGIIAEIVGTTPGTVRATLARLRKTDQRTSVSSLDDA